MKRGLIAWDKTELPPEAFEARLGAARAELARRGLSALIVYSDLWKSNQARFFSNYMPYFNRALLAIPAEGQPVLLCGLSPRVYPWIKSVTILEEILPSPKLPEKLFQTARERGWERLGVVDLHALPYDLHRALSENSLPVQDVPWSAVRPDGPDQWELAMYRKAAAMARAALEDAMRDAADSTDHAFVGGLERRLRLEGAEDLVILLSDGTSAPAPASGQPLGEDFSVSLALEYRGHWVKIVRSRRGGADTAVTCYENLCGPNPYEWAEQPAALSAAVSTTGAAGRRRFQGDTYRGGSELL